MREFDLFIDGKDVPGAARPVHMISPRAMLDDVFGSLRLKRRLDNGGELRPGEDVLARCAIADVAQIEAASAAARRAFPQWRRVPLERRKHFMHRFREELERQEAYMVDLLVEEGHPRTFAEVEIASLIEAASPAAVESYVAHLTPSAGELPSPELRFVRKPDGVVALNPPQNASLINASVGVLTVAAGNTMVVRAPQSMPVGVYALYRDIVIPLLDEIGAPPGTLNLISAPSVLTLNCWLESPDVDDIFYFGDSARGQALAQQCVAAGKKPILDLAGNDCLVAWRDTDPRHAAWALAENFLGSSQFCLVPKLGVVHPAIADRVLEELVDIARSLRPAYPDQRGARLTPVRRSEAFFEVLRDALENGASLLCGGTRWDIDGEVDEAGVFLAPTVLRVDGLAGARRLRAVREETFFPMLPIVVPEPDETGGDDEALLDRIIAFMESNEYGLRNSVWAQDQDVIDRFVTELGVGGLLKINDSHVGCAAPLNAHGGTGLSSGPFGGANLPIITTTHLQGVVIGTGQDPRITVWPKSRRGQEAEHT